MEIGQPAIVRLDSGGVRLSCELSAAGERREVFFRTVAPIESAGVEPFVCLSVIPAMRTGEDIVSRNPVSTRLSEAIPRIEATFANWYPDLHTIRLDAPTEPIPRTASGRGVGCFFSGGVDSFYSVTKHIDDVDTLIFVHGFDIPLANVDLRQRTSTQLRAAAAALGRPLIEVETNAREWLNPFGNWGTHTHGSALASVANFLSGVLRKVYIPSSGTRDEVMAWGSHPFVDPLWSTEAMEIVHDDDSIARLAKLREITQSEFVLAHLRVCWENRNGAYNCGQCEKCLRTMMTLRVLGKLEQCRTFDTPLDLERVTRITSVRSVSRKRFYQEILEAAQLIGDHEVCHAVEQVLFPKWNMGEWFVKKAKGVRRRLLGA